MEENSLTVERGVPMPARSKHRGGKGLYPWRQMAPGDSFVFPPRNTIRHTYNNAQAAVAYRKSGHGETYRVRMVEENGERVVRVWRVA